MAKLIDILKIINRDNSIMILNNMYNTSNGVWTDKLYIKSFKELNIDNITEIEIIIK